ncbi:YtfJ family protein [Babesia caballi]|uniref:YtfJ family protein n=1 Tax=Babesia caballi TaxID=5871 RepID=A0AAV4LRH1_BABCB|nr:YtfJ family protein [Babesia caballi]
MPAAGSLGNLDHRLRQVENLIVVEVPSVEELKGHVHGIVNLNVVEALGKGWWGSTAVDTRFSMFTVCLLIASVLGLLRDIVAVIRARLVLLRYIFHLDVHVVRVGSELLLGLGQRPFELLRGHSSLQHRARRQQFARVVRRGHPGGRQVYEAPLGVEVHDCLAGTGAGSSSSGDVSRGGFRRLPDETGRVRGGWRWDDAGAPVAIQLVEADGDSVDQGALPRDSTPQIVDKVHFDVYGSEALRDGKPQVVRIRLVVGRAALLHGTRLQGIASNINSVGHRFQWDVHASDGLFK